MKIHDVVQGSDEWRELRAGIPTASMAGKLITSTMLVSKSSYPYMCLLIAESMIGPMDECDTKCMQRGSELEVAAIRFYEWDQKVKVKRVGFITTDDGKFGCSPDGLVGEDGGLEVKTPMAGMHIQNVLGMRKQYMPQVQACMMVTGRKWWDLLTYNSRIPEAMFRVKRDEKYIALLQAAIDVFVPTLAQKRQEVWDKLDWRPPRDRTPSARAAVEAPA